MAKPRKIVLKSDNDKKFGSEVFDLIRTQLASKIGGNVNLGVKLAAEHFAPRMPGKITADEMLAAISKIAAEFEAESARKPDNGRLPLNDEAQKLWDSGQWRGKLTVYGLRKRFEAEIGDNVDLTVGMIDAHAAELVAEKTRIAELVSEKSDGNMEQCGFPAHQGSNEPFQLTKRFRPEKDETTGEWRRKKHPQGNEEIEIGNILVLKDEETGEVTSTVSYCHECREKMWNYAREKGEKVTFYTRAGAQRVLEAAKKSAEGQVALGDQLKKAAARVFGGSGTRNQRDWRTTRRPRGR